MSNGRPSAPPTVRSFMCVLACLLLGGGFASSAFAQLTDDDLDKLRERAKTEGWTFEIDRNWATQQPIEQLCGTVVPADYEPPSAGKDGWGTRDDLPVSFDWRDHNGCTPVRNQGGCGSCWAFSAIGAVESAILINDGANVDLSEQWLVSCTGAGSCSGGWPGSALGYIKRDTYWHDQCGDSGAVTEAEFPYVAWDKPCGCPYTHPYWIHNSKGVGGDQWNIDGIKQAILDYGPVSVTVAVDGAFQAYDDGVFNACWNGTINHAVVLVGWDDNQGSDGIWFMRNSWGSWWGESGYMRIEYGCSKIGYGAIYIEYRPDCNDNGVRDDDDIDFCDGSPWCDDCNGNEIPDNCDIASGVSFDCNGNGVPDACDLAGSERVYVDASAGGANTGANWADAITDINAACCMAENQAGVTEVWVRAGTYTPAGAGGDRSASFALRSGVTLRGSFAGAETSPEQRDFSNPANRTVLSGDLNGDDLPGFVNNGENSYHVVTSSGVDSTTILDGFTIVGGNADGVDTAASGGGLLNCDGSPTLTNCAFLGNHAAYAGGAVHNDGAEWGSSQPIFINCVFSGNESEHYAGAVANFGTVIGAVDSTFVNCTIAGNSAALVGGVYAAGNAAAGLTNCAIAGNTDIGPPDEDAQILGYAITVNYCLVEGLTGALGGVGNIGGDPAFVDPAGPDGQPGTLDDNLQLQPCSPCTDAGNNSAVPAEITTDLAGNPRMIDDPVMPDSGAGTAPIVDMGAYEFTGEHVGDLDGDGDVDLSDLAILLGNFGQTSGMTYSDGDLDDDGDVDLSDLSAMLAVFGTGC